METNNNNVDHRLLHWVTLKAILEYLVDTYGYEELSELIRVNCFVSNPSLQSCLKFFRKTDWARLQLQWLYIRTKLGHR